MKKSPNAAFISIHELREIRAKTEKGEQPGASIISNNELQRIKGTMVIKTQEQMEDEKKKTAQ